MAKHSPDGRIVRKNVNKSNKIDSLASAISSSGTSLFWGKISFAKPLKKRIWHRLFRLETEIRPELAHASLGF